MLPFLYPLLNVPALHPYVGTDDPRIYDFGEVPQGTDAAYITFWQVTDQPHEQISGAPCSDEVTMQVDCYSKSRSDCREMAKAVRRIFDDLGYSNRLIIQTYEAETKLYRISFEVEIFENR